MNKRRCRISYAFKLDGQLAVSSFETFFPDRIEDDGNFYDTIIARILENMQSNDICVAYEDTVVLGWSFYD
jgi:hypothetical protein